MSGFGGLPRLFIAIGVVFLIVGGLLSLVDKVPGLGRLPGDIYIRRPGFTLYIPITTMLLISLILSLISGIFRR